MPEVGNKLAGHAPATIVGGKRVPGPRTRTESTGSNHNGSRKDSSIDSTGSEEKIEQTVQSSQVNQAGSLVDGVSVRLEEAYPAEAVKKYHEKPIPTHSKVENYKSVNHKQQAQLFQPRRQAQ